MYDTINKMLGVDIIFGNGKLKSEFEELETNYEELKIKLDNAYKQINKLNIESYKKDGTIKNLEGIIDSLKLKIENLEEKITFEDLRELRSKYRDEIKNLKAEYEKIIKEKDLALHNEKLKFQNIKTKVIKYDGEREEYVNQLENRQIGRKQKLSDEQKNLF